MKTSQINIIAGVKIPVAFGHVRYEVTEIVDLAPEDDRDLVLKEKRIDLTKHVYDHAHQMLNRLESDMAARGGARK